MKLQTFNDTIVDTIADGMKITDVINVKIRSAELEVCCVLYAPNWGNAWSAGHI